MVIWTIFLVYLILGALFSVHFLIKGIDSLDDAAKGAGWKFKILILPGCVLLWPALMYKFRKP